MRLRCTLRSRPMFGLLATVLLLTVTTLRAAPPAPALSIASAPGQVTLTWPSEDFWLQSSPDLTPNSWVNVNNTPTQSGAADSLTLPTVASAQFFRLIES